MSTLIGYAYRDSLYCPLHKPRLDPAREAELETLYDHHDLTADFAAQQAVCETCLYFQRQDAQAVIDRACI